MSLADQHWREDNLRAAAMRGATSGSGMGGNGRRLSAPSLSHHHQRRHADPRRDRGRAGAGRVVASLMSRPLPIATRLERLSVSDEETGCLVWQGAKDRRGYGHIRGSDGRTLSAHRASYQEHREQIPDGLQIDHLCRNTSCINPAHLEVVTPRENTLRSEGCTAINSRKTHCNNGHPFDAENTYRWRGGRYCRACNRAAQRRASNRLAVPR